MTHFSLAVADDPDYTWTSEPPPGWDQPQFYEPLLELNKRVIQALHTPGGILGLVKVSSAWKEKNGLAYDISDSVRDFLDVLSAAEKNPANWLTVLIDFRMPASMAAAVYLDPAEERQSFRI